VLNAYYAFFAAWSKRTDLVTYDEFLYAESDMAARTDFEAKIAKRYGANWREGQYNVTIRNLSRIVHAMVAEERQRGPEASSEAPRVDPGVS
jgi:hypothetical protein